MCDDPTEDRDVNGYPRKERPSLGSMSSSDMRALRRFWPEVCLVFWLVSFFATDFVFRDDESIAHHALHLGLWISLALYIALSLREHLTASS